MSFRRYRYPTGWPFVIMWLLVWSYSLSFELQYKPQSHMAVFPLPPKKYCPKPRLHEIRWSLKSYCTATCTKKWNFHIIFNNILFLDMTLCYNLNEVPRHCLLLLCSLKLFSFSDNHHKPVCSSEEQVQQNTYRADTV